MRTPGHPARLGGGVDLPAPERSPAGGRHRRGRAAAVPLPPGVAPQAGRVQARPGAGGRRATASSAPTGGGPPPARRDAVRARPGHRVPPAGSRLLPDRRGDLRRGEPLLRSGHDPQGARHRGEPHRGLRLRRQVRSGAIRRLGRRPRPGLGRRSPPASQWWAGAAGLQGRPPLAGRHLHRHQRLREGAGRRRGLGQGLPHLARHGDRRRRPGRASTRTRPRRPRASVPSAPP